MRCAVDEMPFDLEIDVPVDVEAGGEYLVEDVVPGVAVSDRPVIDVARVVTAQFQPFGEPVRQRHVA